MNTHGNGLDGQSYLAAVSDEDFSANALGAALPVLVEVGAPSCAPCRLMDPIIADLAREYHGSILFLTLDADDNPRTPAT